MHAFRKLAAAATLFIGVAACSDLTELDLQDSPNQVSPENAGQEFLYNSIQLKFAEIFMGVGNDNGTLNTTPNLYRFAGDLTRVTAMTGGSVYQNAFQPTYFDALWTDVYADLLPDIAALERLSNERGQTKELGTAKIMQAYVLFMLVDIFGEVPFSEIGQGVEIISPVADSGEDVYAAALALLDEGVALLQDEDSPDFLRSGEIDNFYAGDTEDWVTLANTLRLRSAVTTRLVNGNAAAQAAAAIEAGVIESAGSDWQWNFGNSRVNPSTRHPLYIEGYESVDGDYFGNYFLWKLAQEKFIGDSIVDPRARYYFYRQDANLVEDIITQSNAFDCILSAVPDRDDTPQHYLDIDPNMPYCLGDATEEVGSNGYFGRDHGNNSGIPPDGALRTVYGVYPAGGLFDNGSGQTTQNGGTDGALGEGIIPFMLSTYVNFYRAEAALTLGTSDDARAQLEAGMRSSFAKVGGFAGSPSIEEAFDSTTVDDYVDFVLDQYDNADDDNERLNIVSNEFYIAYFGQPYEVYNLYRRTCAPTNMQPLLENPQAGSEFTRSAFYPAVYVQRNSNKEQKPGTTVNVFWDTNSSGTCNY